MSAVARLLAPSSAEPRLSQILPGVTCSSCGQNVSLDELGDHICGSSKPAGPANDRKPHKPTPSVSSFASSASSSRPSLDSISSSSSSASPRDQIGNDRSFSPSLNDQQPPQIDAKHRPSLSSEPRTSLDDDDDRRQSQASMYSTSSRPESPTDDENLDTPPLDATFSDVRSTTPLAISPGVPLNPSQMHASPTRPLQPQMSPSSLPEVRPRIMPNGSPMDPRPRVMSSASQFNPRPRLLSSASQMGGEVAMAAAGRPRVMSSASQISPHIMSNLTRPPFERSGSLPSPGPRPPFPPPRAPTSPLSPGPLRPSFDRSDRRPSFDSTRAPSPLVPRTGTPGPTSPRIPPPLPGTPGARSIALPDSNNRDSSMTITPMTPATPTAATRSHLSIDVRSGSESYVSEPDTKIGGEAGMAGVGRRGFAAAARVAMFTSNLYPHTPLSPGFLPFPAGGDSIIRTGTPQLSVYSQSGTTPPLSPASPSGYSSHSAGPSPLPSPAYAEGDAYPSLSTIPDTRKPPRSPGPPAPAFLTSSRPGTFYAVNPDPEPLLSEPGNLFGGEDDLLLPSPFPDDDDDEEENGDKRDTLRVGTVLPPSVSRRKSRRSVSPVGLAYADDDDDDDHAGGGRGMRIVTDSPRSVADDLPSPSSPSAKRTSGQSTSRYSRSTVHSSRALDALLSAIPDVGESKNNDDKEEEEKEKTAAGETDDDDDDIILGVLAAHETGERGSRLMMRSNTVPAPPVSPSTTMPMFGGDLSAAGVAAAANAVRRSHTSPINKPVPAATRRRRRVCIRCEKVIDDGRWVAVEHEDVTDGGDAAGSGGGVGVAGGAASAQKKKEVLCERCWKNMYLPKCRRCNLPIEKQAVSSSDGQLKGKYHRDCFNCHTCHKPFPDKTFYVYDGRPYCDYHYHEANNSLCAAPTCGRPIEGPCAVSHNGARYHPEHLLCEYVYQDDVERIADGRGEGNGCGERLLDYWEVDGRMVCEKHARAMGGLLSVDETESVVSGGAGGRLSTATATAPAAEDEDDDLPLADLKKNDVGVRGSFVRAMKRRTRFISLGDASGLI